MNIYFAGSIRGGRKDAELYHQMISYLQKKHRVLTEHIGNLSLSSLEGKNGNDEKIYQQDIGWLKQADVVIAECSNPSLGVGYELAFAEAQAIPVHVFFREGDGHLSAMIAGDPYFTVHYYRDIEEVYRFFDSL